MNFDETKKLLMRVNVHDNRKVDGLVVEHWADILRDYTEKECMAALRWFIMTNTEDYLKPAHLVQYMNQRRREHAWANPAMEAGKYFLDGWVDQDEAIQRASEENRRLRGGKPTAVDVAESYTKEELEEFKGMMIPPPEGLG